MKRKEVLNIEAFKAVLHRNYLKATPQRIAVHVAMRKLEHASADMVVKEIEEAGTAKVTIASVYNILCQLSDVHIYQRRFSINSKMYFDVRPQPHAHVYDLSNNTYKNLVDEELTDAVKECLGRRKFKGYTVEGLDILLTVKPNARRRKKVQEAI